MTTKVNIAKIKPNEENPRFITDGKFKKLVNSIKSFPEMLEVRPLVVDENMVVLGGNMRLKALKSAGVFEVPIKQISGWSKEKKKEFIIKDNVGYGQWDWDIIANDWDLDKLTDWGLDLPQINKDVDYSILDDYDLSGDLDDMQNGVKKAIQIPFDSKHYEEAFELVKYWREQGGYVGMMLIDKLKYEKLKNEKN
jgi:ParB-like chromosome segregation protein Spo0J